MSTLDEDLLHPLDAHGIDGAPTEPGWYIVALAFDVAVKDGRIRKGDLVLFEAMGGGFTWGAVLARY